MWSGKWLTPIAVLLCLCGAVFAWKRSNPLGADSALRDLNRHKVEAYEAYAKEPFAKATNALGRYIVFLEANKNRVSTARNVDLLLYIARAKLGYMLLCAGQIEPAYGQLSLAYEAYERLQLRSGSERVPRSEFVEFVVAGVEKIDAKAGAAWKSNYVLNTSVVAMMKARFASNSVNGPIGSGRSTPTIPMQN